ncbi:unnamed protein product [Brassica napus]|uniref:(rape) hypothetical protein n=1 Tax=Brassica napus TaxID=3708 RepID=A0A816PCW4_BRANA|nr:unnamed protein product [Brassica napus]
MLSLTRLVHLKFIFFYFSFSFLFLQHAKGILAHNSRARFFCSNTNVNPSGFPKFNPSLALYQKAEISLRFNQALEVSKVYG